MNPLAQFSQWCQRLPLAEAIRSQPWPFPLIEIFHLTGMVLVYGSVLVTSLRMFGLILNGTPVSQVAANLTRFTVIGLGIQAFSGPLMFITSAERFYESGPFRLKLALLVGALIYHFGIHLRVAARGGRAVQMMSAAVSLALWSGVILSGLAIELLA